MGHYDKFQEQTAEEFLAAVKKALSQIEREEELASRDMYDFQEPEFWDFLHILELGSAKHDKDGEINYLKSDGKGCSHREMYDSMFHHLAEGYAGVVRDLETGEHPLLHLIARASILYMRQKRGLIHPKDL
jgi:hypothetical protein